MRTTTHRTQAFRGLITALLGSAALGSPAPQAPAGAPAQGTASAESAAAGLAASAFDTVLTFEELDQLLIERRALSEDGREALKHLVRARLLDRLAEESNLKVTPADIDAQVRDIEEQMHAQGSQLSDYLEENRVTLDVFRQFLRLGIVQEALSRRALGIPEDQTVPADQQDMWLDQVIEQRGSHLPPPPWSDGIAARCGDLEVTKEELVVHLRTQLPLESVREDCYQLLLNKRMRARMPDLAPETLENAIAVELERRRREIAADPQFHGLSFEELMASQGIQPAFLPRDPAVVAAALAQLWVDRTADEAEMRRIYQEERSYFDGIYGEALDTRLVFLRAAVLTNQLIPRSFDVAIDELTTAAKGLRTVEQFEAFVKLNSEDNGTRESGGHLGYVAKGDERIPEEIRLALFPGGKALEEGNRTVGPLRIQSGVLLLWIGDRRPSPSWDTMATYVRDELRRRFMDEVLPRDAMHTFLDID